MLDPFLRYLDTNHPDYAIMLDGPWGSGKTHWIRNTVILTAKECGYRPIYVSAASAASPAALEKAIIVSRVMRQSEAQQTDPGLLEAALGVAQLYPASAAVTKSLGGVARSAGKAISRGLSFEKTLIIIDDLERVNRDMTAHELLGYLFQRFVDSGHAHMVVVGNLQKLSVPSDGNSDNKFDEVREKYIRLVVPFRPSRDDQVKELATPISVASVRDATEAAIISFADRYDDFNLRTVQYVVSQIHQLEVVLEENTGALSIDDVTTTMLVYATELAEGRVDPTNASGLFSLTQAMEGESIRRQLRENAGLDDEERSVGADLKKRYGDILLRRLVPLRFLAELMTGHGYSDDSARTEIEEYLRKGKTLEQKALDDLAAFYIQEFGELNQVAQQVVAYAADGKYEAERFPYITSLIDFLIRKEFLTGVPNNWLEQLRSGGDRSLIGRTDFRFVGSHVTDPVVNNIYDNTRPPPPCVVDMQELVKSRLLQATVEQSSGTVLNFFAQLQATPENKRGLVYRTVRSDIDFSIIDVERFVDIVAGMKNDGLYWVGIILDDLFEGTSQRPGLESEKPVLSDIASRLKRRWEHESDVDPLRRYQRKTVISKFRQYAEA